MLHESLQSFCVGAVWRTTRRGLGPAGRGCNKSTAKAIAGPANDQYIHGDPAFGCSSQLVSSLKSHGNDAARIPMIVGDDVQAARADVGNGMRAGSASRPV